MRVFTEILPIPLTGTHSDPSGRPDVFTHFGVNLPFPYQRGLIQRGGDSVTPWVCTFQGGLSVSPKNGVTQEDTLRTKTYPDTSRDTHGSWLPRLCALRSFPVSLPHPDRRRSTCLNRHRVEGTVYTTMWSTRQIRHDTLRTRCLGDLDSRTGRKGVVGHPGDTQRVPGTSNLSHRSRLNHILSPDWT